MLGNGDGSVGMFSSLIVAALSGCVNVLLTNPIWLVVTRMQTHKKELKRTIPDPRLSDATEQKLLFTVEHHAYGTSHVIQEVYDESGVLGFWKGVLPTLVMVSNPSIQFMLYETLLAKLKKRSANNTVSALQQARLQARQVKNGDKRHHYKGTRDAIFKMIRYEGFNGFYKGMGTKIVQSVLAGAVLFMVKE